MDATYFSASADSLSFHNQLVLIYLV